tara:strand:- start:198 stop:848 length:651 start_codon:yes stop_codon:yes gene_type:complete
MVNLTKLYDEAFLTGCDSGHEWLLPWFLKNFKTHCKKPLIFADFGLSDIGRAVVRENVHAVMDLTNAEERGWFKKPLSMYKCPAKKTVWIDTDCQVKENIDGIFDLLEPQKLAMVEDKPWSWRRGHIWHNSGVVGFIDKPMILRQWVSATKSNKDQVGDQEVLDKILSPITKISLIKELPNEWNVLRLQLNDGYKGNIKIMHWTGQKGKEKIRSML